MKLEDFINLEDKFVLALLNSSLYKEYKKYNDLILNDERIKSLSLKRDEAYLKAKENINVEDNLILAKKYQDEILSLDISKKYTKLYNKLKAIIKSINDNIIKEVIR